MTDVSYHDDAESPVLGTGDTHPNLFVRALNAVPRILSSKIHIVLLFALGLYIVVLPLLGVAVSQTSMLIGGNYENTTSDIGACIAAGGTVHLIKRNRTRHAAAEAHEARIEASQQAVHDHLGTGHVVKETT